ncbi:unnamed protein product, partial [Porites lobata]
MLTIREAFLSRVRPFMEMLDQSSLDDRNIDSMLVVLPCRTPRFSQHDVEYTGASGRPKIRVTKEQLSHLAGNGFKGTDMFRMLSISQATLHGQLKDFNLEISHSFSTIDNDTLDGIVRSIKEEFPN